MGQPAYVPRHAARHVTVSLGWLTFALVVLIVSGVGLAAWPVNRASTIAETAQNHAENLGTTVADLCAGSKGPEVAVALAGARTRDGQLLCPAAQQAATPVTIRNQATITETAPAPPPVTFTTTAPAPPPTTVTETTTARSMPEFRNPVTVTQTPSPYQREMYPYPPAPATVTQTQTQPAPVTVTQPAPVTQTQIVPTQQATSPGAGTSNQTPGTSLLGGVGSLLAGL